MLRGALREFGLFSFLFFSFVWLWFSTGEYFADAHGRPHTLSGDDLYKAHLVPYLIEARDALTERIETTEDENVELVSTITRQRAEINQLLSKLEGFIRDLSIAAQALEKFDPNGNLRREAEKVLVNNQQ